MEIIVFCNQLNKNPAVCRIKAIGYTETDNVLLNYFISFSPIMKENLIESDWLQKSNSLLFCGHNSYSTPFNISPVHFQMQVYSCIFIHISICLTFIDHCQSHIINDCSHLLTFWIWWRETESRLITKQSYIKADNACQEQVVSKVLQLANKPV